MTSSENKNIHQKHTKLARPNFGNFGRVELAFLGTPCHTIKKVAYSIIQNLASGLKIAYVDADHKNSDAAAETGPDLTTALGNGAYLEYTDKITFRRLDYRDPGSEFEQKALFENADIVLVNGNHFAAQAQVIVIDPVKPLDKKLHKLTNVQLILMQDGVKEVPEYLQKHLVNYAAIPVYPLSDIKQLTHYVEQYYAKNIPPLHGLVLAGGKSTRMQQDKGALQYHGQDQRSHVHALLCKFCPEVYVSCTAQQAHALSQTIPFLEDRFLNLGPKGGILTALQQNPNAAWLAVACDLPFLSSDTLAYLVQHRDPTKMATAFYDSDGKFPEPLLTIWEPRSYSRLLQFLSLGYSCPRKALINSEIKLLTIPDVKELQNVNDREAYAKSLAEIEKISK